MIDVLRNPESLAAPTPPEPSPPAELVEARLVSALREGDTGAFEQLYRREVRPLYGLAMRLSCRPSPTPEGLYQHYRAIAEAVPLPIVVYNVPGRTGCNVDVATLVRLSAIPNVLGVKEASGNMTQMCDVCRAVPEDFLVLSGDDVLTLPLMAVGGRGIISVASNEVPAEMARMVEAAERGDYAAARRIHNQLHPLLMINFIEANPIPVKSAMAAMRLLEEVYRLPMVPPRAESKAKIVEVLQALRLTEPAARIQNSESRIQKQTASG